MKCQCITDQRRLVPAVFNLKQALNGTQTMTWTLTEHLTAEGTCDLCNYDPYLLLSVGGQIDEVMLSRNMVDVDGDGVAETMQIHWAVGAYATELTGYVKYQIVFRSAEVNSLGVIGSEDESANGNYKLTSGSEGTARVWTNEVSGYVCRYNDAEARWEIYGADGASLVHYQVFPQDEPFNGAWNDCAVGNNTAAVWASDEAIMHISESIAADPHVTANYPTILRQMWFALQRGAASTGGSNSMEVPVKSAEWSGSAAPYSVTAGKEQTLGAKVHAAYFRNSAGVMVDNMEFVINAAGVTVSSLEALNGTLVLVVSKPDTEDGNGGNGGGNTGGGDNTGNDSGSGDDSGDSSGDSGKTYLYTVTGSPEPAVNGDYYDTGETFNGEPIYTNGTAYLQYCGGNGMWGNWSIHNTKADSTYDTCYCYATSGITGTYSSGQLASGGATVAQYSAGSSSGSGSATEKITVSGLEYERATFNQEYTWDGTVWRSTAGPVIKYMTNPMNGVNCWCFIQNEDAPWGWTHGFSAVTSPDYTAVKNITTYSDTEARSFPVTITTAGGSASGGGTITVTGCTQAIPGGSPNGTYTYESGSLDGGGGAIFRHTERTDFTCLVTYDGWATTLYIRSGDSRYMGSDSPGNTLKEMGAAGTPFGSFYWVEEGSGMSGSIDGMSATYTP